MKLKDISKIEVEKSGMVMILSWFEDTQEWDIQYVEKEEQEVDFGVRIYCECYLIEEDRDIKPPLPVEIIRVVDIAKLVRTYNLGKVVE